MCRENRVASGYERIAFGSIRDPVRLLFLKEPRAETIQAMDLFSISEIKKPRDGGMEIKFFDRMKALQCLQELSEKDETVSDVLKAIEEGASALKESGAGDVE